MEIYFAAVPGGRTRLGVEMLLPRGTLSFYSKDVLVSLKYCLELLYFRGVEVF